MHTAPAWIFGACRSLRLIRTNNDHIQLGIQPNAGDMVVYLGADAAMPGKEGLFGRSGYVMPSRSAKE